MPIMSRCGRPGSPIIHVLREPVMHFMAIGLVIFTLNALGTSGPTTGADDTRRIVVTEGRVRQLVNVFAMTWKRPPTEEELRGLIDAFVKEEVYYREARRLGLDRDDTLVRRRMQQKMEFLVEPDSNVLKADEEILQAWLAANRERFRVPPKAAFAQILIRDGEEAAPILERLRKNAAGAEFAELGVRTVLPREMPLTPVETIARIFGTEFAGVLPALPRNEWSGPVPSAYGLHLVRITAWAEAVDPPLDEIRPEVERHWRQARRSTHLKSEYKKLRAKYEVVLPSLRPPRRQALVQ